MEKLKVAIIGLQHLHPVSYLPHIINNNLELTSISDDDESLFKKLCNEFHSNVKFYTDYKKLIDNEKLDIVFIFSPHYLCPDVVEYAASKKINIVVEKPIAASYEGALRILKACESNDIIASVPYAWRFHAAAKNIKKIIDFGYLGEIKALEGRCIAGRISRYIEGNSSWMLEKSKSGGGPMWNLGVHWIDLFRYFMNFPKVKRVYAEYSNITENIDIEENSFGIIRFDNDAVATLNVGYSSPPSFPYGRDLHINIRGTLGSITWNPAFEGTEDEIFLCSDHPEISAAPNRTIKMIQKVAKGYVGMMGFEFVKHFVECVKSNKQPLISIKEAVEVIEIAEALNKSAEKGVGVSL